LQVTARPPCSPDGGAPEPGIGACPRRSLRDVNGWNGTYGRADRQPPGLWLRATRRLKWLFLLAASRVLASCTHGICCLHVQHDVGPGLGPGVGYVEHAVISS
jgi:hypothetical protein